MSDPQRPEAEQAAPSAPSAGVERQAGELAQLRTEVETLRSRSERLLANWQRAEADIVNLRRRVDAERADMQMAAVATVVGSLLPVLDDLERALNAVAEPLRDFTWVDGIWLTYRKFLVILEALDVLPMDEAGKSFDPARHQAVREAAGEAGKVLHVLQQGYMLKTTVLRPALVVVGKEAEPGA
ncbi:MAG: nucleotide exchange factor GrpE [Dehalococcoidia bacterium]|nr:nucleotide exchange factor GrpE [Dehalococcoidia bacterium]